MGMKKCGCECGPWIRLSQCGVGKFDRRTGKLVEVTCPSRFCMTWARLVDGKIAAHSGTIDAIVPGGCPWIGTRVVDDRADFGIRVTPPETQ